MAKLEYLVNLSPSSSAIAFLNHHSFSDGDSVGGFNLSPLAQKR